VHSFEWQKQLRYYVGSFEAQSVVIRQVKCNFLYQYEYFGNQTRLVQTALTDLVFLTMTQSLHFFYGGSPQGPAGTGKTETIKDLAKALG